MTQLLVKAILVLSIVFVVVLTAPTIVFADSVVRTGESVSIAADQKIEGDLYAAAGKVNISGEVAEDAIIAAGQITLNGTVGANAFLFAGQTSIHGTVGDDLRIVSGEVVIAEPVMGDVLMLGGSLHLLSTASVTGDILMYAGEAIIDGSVGGDVLGTAGTLRIDAPIAGGVDVSVEQFTLGDSANITGAVRYVSNTLVVQSPNAIVSGDLVRSDPVLPGTQSNIRAAVVPLLIILFTILTWYLVSRKTLNQVVERVLTKDTRPVFFGIASILLAPVMIVILFASMIGTMVSLILLFVFLTLLLLGFVGGVAVVGQLLTNVLNQPVKGVSLLSLVTGIVVFALLMLLPVVGQVVVLVVTLASVGAIVDLLYRANKS